MTTVQALEPNPYSPYATADPARRHVFPSFFGAGPLPGVLCIAACEEFAVVPTAPLVDTDPGDPHAGLCPECVETMRRGRRLRALPDQGHRVTGFCLFCDSTTRARDRMCALCRQEQHDEWWPIRPASDVIPTGTVPARIVQPTKEEAAAGARLPDGARLVGNLTWFENPFTAGWAIDADLVVDEDDARSYLVDVYAEWLTAPHADSEWPHLVERRKRVLSLIPDLKGRPLACACEAEAPCCGDVLLELANP